MSAKTLMIAGTMSSVGKSLITAGLCRLFARNGVSVAPFKAQNMSNNAAVCADGGEIGRAQAIQAQAARILPTVDMNPILMKPEADYKSQIIVQGTPIGTFSGRDYYRMRESLWGNVTESLDRLREAHELVLIEGAGSIAELNLAGKRYRQSSRCALCERAGPACRGYRSRRNLHAASREPFASRSGRSGTDPRLHR